MAKKITSETAYLRTPCERCGSKKRIAKTWKEKIPTFNGSTTVEYSQIVCTNIECQTAFETLLNEERKKREEVKIKRENNKKERKASFLANRVKKKK